MKTATNSSIDNGVYNDGACIKIVFEGGIIQVNKAQIKTIDTVRNDIVRIDIGAGAMKNIYIRLAEVQYPKNINDVTALRNYINGLLLQGGNASEATQTTMLNELKGIRDLLNKVLLLQQPKVKPKIQIPVKAKIEESIAKQPAVEPRPSKGLQPMEAQKEKKKMGEVKQELDII